MNRILIRTLNYFKPYEKPHSLQFSDRDAPEGAVAS